MYLPLDIDFTETKFKHINRCRFKFWLSSSYHTPSVSVSANGLLINWKGTARILFWERIEFCITLFQLIIQLYWIPSHSLILNMMECLEINEIGYKWGRNKSLLMKFLSFTYLILVIYFQFTSYFNWKSLHCSIPWSLKYIYVSQSLTPLDSY